MKSVFKPSALLAGLALAALFTSQAGSAMAQPAASATPPATASGNASPNQQRMGRHEPARMQAWIAKRQAALKAKLKITPAQEGAWTSFTAAMQPPAAMGRRPAPEQRAEFDKLTTPERIDKMRAMRTQRMTEMNAAMDRRGEATKAFYAALSPEQQKTFDVEAMRMGRHAGRGHHMHRNG